MKRIILILTSILAAIGCKSPEIVSSVVFKQGEDSCYYYRIPAMTLDEDENIIAVIDRRYETNADLGGRNTSIDVSSRRSTDGGRTWSEQKIIAEGDTSRTIGFGFGDAALLRSKSGRILCLMACGNGKNGFISGLKHAAITSSKDGGITWSKVRIIPFPEDIHSAFISSGKGVVDNDGDILLATCVLPKDTPAPLPFPLPINVHLLYSTDEGENWTLEDEPAYKYGDEAKLAVLPNGQLLLSSRVGRYGPRGFNTASKGDDGLYHWNEQWTAESLNANPCNGDIILWKDNILLHSYIKNEHNRSGLTIAASLDSGKTWTDVLTIQEGPSAYSTMVCFKNGDVGILYEDGSNTKDGGYDIVFSRIPQRLLKDKIK